MKTAADLPSERRRDRRVTFALLYFWGTTFAAWISWWLWPLQYESFSGTVTPVAPVLALIYVLLWLCVLYACLRHANGDRYEGAHPVAWSLFLIVLRR